MPTRDYYGEKIEKMYDEISDILHREGRGRVNLLVMGDFNSIVGEGYTNKVAGHLDSVKEMREARCSSTSASSII